MVGIWKLASLSRRYATWRDVEPSTFRTPFRGITSSWNWVIRSKPTGNALDQNNRFDNVLVAWWFISVSLWHGKHSAKQTIKEDWKNKTFHLFEWVQMLRKCLKTGFLRWKCEYCASIALLDVVFGVDSYSVELCYVATRRSGRKTKPAENREFCLKFEINFNYCYSPGCIINEDNCS